MSAHLPRWEPGTHAVHRLIQLADVMAIAFNRCRQLSFRLPDPTQPDAGPRFMAERTRLWDDYNEVRRAIFPAADFAPPYTAKQLTDDATAELVRRGGTPPPVFAEVGQWLGWVGFHFHPHTYPRSLLPKDHEQFDLDGENLLRYSALREQLFSALAGIGEAVPGPVRRRRSVMYYPWNIPGEEPVTQAQLLAWVREALSTAGDPPQTPKAAPDRRRKGGRRPHDPKFDRQVAEAWATGRHKTYADLARALGCKLKDVQAALDRYRKAQKRTAGD